MQDVFAVTLCKIKNNRFLRDQFGNKVIICTKKPRKREFPKFFFRCLDVSLAFIHPFLAFYIRKHIISNKKNLIPCCKLQTSRMEKLVFLHTVYIYIRI